MKTIGLAVIWTLALCGACGGDDGGGTARAAACKPFIEQAKKCDAVVDCEDVASTPTQWGI